MKPFQASKQKESQSYKSAAKVLALSLMAVSLTVATAFVYSNHTEGSAQAAPTRPAAANQFQAGGQTEPAEPASRAGRPAQPDRAGEIPGTPVSKVVPQDLCSLGLQQSPMIRVSYTISTMPTCLKKMLSLNHLVLPNDETPQDLSGFSASSGNSVSV